MALLAALMLSGAFAADTPALKAGTFDPPRMAPHFRLQSSGGGEVSLEQFRGKVVALGFGFTNCTQVCPITLNTLAVARKELGAAARDLQVVYVTVDPERDDAAQLARYLGAFDKTFVGATGSEAALAKVRTEYGVSAQKIAQPAGAYQYGHSSFVYLIDRAGRLVALMPYGHEAKDYVHDLNVLLAAP